MKRTKTLAVTLFKISVILFHTSCPNYPGLISWMVYVFLWHGARDILTALSLTVFLTLINLSFSLGCCDEICLIYYRKVMAFPPRGFIQSPVLCWQFTLMTLWHPYRCLLLQIYLLHSTSFTSLEIFAFLQGLSLLLLSKHLSESSPEGLFCLFLFLFFPFVSWYYLYCLLLLGESTHKIYDIS